MLWFDVAWAVSRQPADLLSAANMRAKLVNCSPVAEALFTHLLTIPGLSERETAMTVEQLRRLAVAKATAAEAAELEYGCMC